MDLCSKNAVLNVSDFESKVKEATNRLFSVKISLRFEGFQRLDRLRCISYPDRSADDVRGGSAQRGVGALWHCAARDRSCDNRRAAADPHPADSV